jgi:hypothetical protein
VVVRTEGNRLFEVRHFCDELEESIVVDNASLLLILRGIVVSFNFHVVFQRTVLLGIETNLFMFLSGGNVVDVVGSSEDEIGRNQDARAFIDAAVLIDTLNVAVGRSWPLVHILG